MCGLSGGLSSRLFKGDVDVIQTLALLSNLRGGHSTGVMIGKEKPNKRGVKKGFSPQYIWSKQLGPSIPFIYEEKITKHLEPKANPFLYAVHTRYATLGEISVDNAHPFSCGDVIGMHNGTAPSFSPSKGVNKTDSQCIFEHINAFGIEATIKKMDHRDAYALVWVDTVTNRLNFIRNNKRTLFFASSPKEDTIYWSSEYGMLSFALAREDQPNFTIKTFEENSHVSINLMDLTDVTSTKISPWPKSWSSTIANRIMGDSWEEYKPPVVTKEAAHQAKSRSVVPFVNNTTTRGPREYKEGVQPLLRYYPFKDDKKVDRCQVLVEVYNEYLMNLESFNTAIDRGCSLCTHKPSAGLVIQRKEKIHWFDKSGFICDSCLVEGGVLITGHIKQQPTDNSRFKERVQPS